MSGSGSTLIADLGKIRDNDQPDQSEVNELLRQIERSDNPPVEEVEDQQPHMTDEPSSDDMEAAMRMVSQAPNVRRAAHTALKNRGQRRAPARQRYEDDEYIPEPARPTARQGPTTRQLIVQHLHLPIIIALAVVVAFASPLSDTIGTWIPSAAGAVYNGALQPTGLYVRAALVGLIIAIYKYFVSSVFPSIPM